MTNNYKQLLISGILGDGSLCSNGRVSYSCLHKEYLEFKTSLIPEMECKITTKLNSGYNKENAISTFATRANELGKRFYNSPLSEIVEDIDELGLALWFYDDGSLHKKNHFFNINTHSFSEEEERNVLIPLLNRFNIFPKIMKERKKDGREFTYLYVAKHKGVFEITRILRKYPIKCYEYKQIPDEEFKRFELIHERYKGYKINRKVLSNLLNRKVKDFDEFISNNVHILKGDFISPNKKACFEVDENTIYL